MVDKKDDFIMHKFIAVFCALCAFTCICWEYQVLEFVYIVIFVIVFYLLVKIFKCNQQIKQLKKEDEK